MFRWLKNILFGRFIRSKPYTDTHARNTIPYAEIRSIGFLVDGSDPIALRELLNGLKNMRSKGKNSSSSDT
ncbi:MAG: hypothetical protein R2794_08140 [Chitinophagales bacterium]